MVSYADFMTLLFAFFTALYSTSNVDRLKLNRFVQSMQVAFVNSPNKAAQSKPGANAVTPSVGSPTMSDSEKSDLDLQKELRERLAEELKQGAVALDVDSRGVVISLRESGSFP